MIDHNAVHMQGGVVVSTDYRQFPSLQEYLLVDMDSRCCDVYRLSAQGLWLLHTFGKGQPVTLASVDLSLSAAQLFAQVTDD